MIGMIRFEGAVNECMDLLSIIILRLPIPNLRVLSTSEVTNVVYPCQFGNLDYTGQTPMEGHLLKPQRALCLIRYPEPGVSHCSVLLFAT